MLPIFPLAKNVLSICRQNSPSIESNNNHYTKNILAILARKCAEIRWLQKIAVIWLQIFEGSYFAKTSPRFQNSGELFCHFQDLIFDREYDSRGPRNTNDGSGTQPLKIKEIL